MYYLSIDPGQATGYACFDKQGKLLDFGILRTEQAFFRFLKEIDDPPTLIICEEYKLFQRKAIQQSGSDMVASRMVGALEYFAFLHSTPIVFQPASIKKIAEMWSGKPAPKNHAESHGIDAYNHGIYYLQKNNIIRPVK